VRKPTILQVLAVIIIGVAALWLVKKWPGMPSFGSIFTSKPVVIDKTPILIKNIRSIGQLVSVAAYDEVVADSVIFTRAASFLDVLRNTTPLGVLPSFTKQLVLIGKGKVLCGTNLQNISASDIVTRNDSLWITVPQATIIDVIINPSDFETFEEKGDWSAAEVMAVKVKAKRKMMNRALAQNIIIKADTKAKNTLTIFFENAGFRWVGVSVKP